MNAREERDGLFAIFREQKQPGPTSNKQMVICSGPDTE
jgi:hypothetical protein